jgi:hypothetical protein
MNGDNSMPYFDGSNPYLVNCVQVNDLPHPIREVCPGCG